MSEKLLSNLPMDNEETHIKQTTEKELIISVYDIIVDKFSNSFDELLKQCACKESFEFLGREYEPKKYVIRASESQAKVVDQVFGRYIMYHRIQKREKDADVYLID